MHSTVKMGFLHTKGYHNPTVHSAYKRYLSLDVRIFVAEVTISFSLFWIWTLQRYIYIQHSKSNAGLHILLSRNRSKPYRYDRIRSATILMIRFRGAYDIEMCSYIRFQYFGWSWPAFWLIKIDVVGRMTSNMVSGYSPWYPHSRKFTWPETPTCCFLSSSSLTWTCHCCAMTDIPTSFCSSLNCYTGYKDMHRA